MTRQFTRLALSLCLLVAAAGCGKPKPLELPPRVALSVASKAEELRKQHNSVHIYAVPNRYEVWTSGVFPGKWKDAATLDEARLIVDAYYNQWAQNCIGPVIDGTLVE